MTHDLQQSGRRIHLQLEVEKSLSVRLFVCSVTVLRSTISFEPPPDLADLWLETILLLCFSRLQSWAVLIGEDGKIFETEIRIWLLRSSTLSVYLAMPGSREELKATAPRRIPVQGRLAWQKSYIPDSTANVFLGTLKKAAFVFLEQAPFTAMATKNRGML